MAKIIGLKRLKAKFKQIDQQTAVAVETAILNGANQIKDSAGQKAPGKFKLKRAMTIEIKAKTGKRLLLHIGPAKKAFYAKWVEEGHALVKKIGGQKQVIGHVPAYPYLRPAFEENKVQILTQIGAVIKGVMK